MRSLERDPESIVATAIGNTMGPFGVLRTQQLVPDPLGLFPHYLGTLMPTGIELFDGMPMVHSGDRHYALLLTTAIRGAFDLDETESLLDFVAQARAWAATRNVELLVTGVPLFAATNAQRAQFEVSTVGTGSMIAVILLFLITFRSVRPLLLATLAICTGLLVAFTVSIWLFDRVHLLTFVFGATLIGVSDDYALALPVRRVSFAELEPEGRNAARATWTRARARNDADGLCESRHRAVSGAASDRGVLRRRFARCVAHGRTAAAFAHKGVAQHVRP